MEAGRSVLLRAEQRARAPQSPSQVLASPSPELDKLMAVEPEFPIVRPLFRWGGRNSDNDRRQASEHLARHVRQALSSMTKRVHIVAHSHGGNVVLDALRLRSDAFERSGEGEGLRSVILLGTPVLERPPAKVSPFVVAGAGAALFAFAVIALIFDLFAARSMIWWPIALLVAGIGLTVVVPAIVQMETRKSLTGRRIHTIMSRYDEAYHLLKAAIELRKMHASIARNLVPIQFQPLFVGRFPPLDNYLFPLKALAVAFRKRFLTRADLAYIAANVIAYTVTFPLLLFALIDVLFLGIVTAASSVMRRIAISAGLEGLANTALGQDQVLGRITRVTDAPSDFESISVPLDEQTELAIRDLASKSEAGLGGRLYMSVGLVDPAEALSLDAIESVYTSAELVHGQYYARPEIIRKIAEVIAASSPVVAQELQGSGR